MVLGKSSESGPARKVDRQRILEERPKDYERDQNISVKRTF